MFKSCMVFINTIVILSAVSIVLAQDTSWGTTFKSAVQKAAEVAVQKITPEAQQTVDQAKNLETSAKQENFIIAKAKEYLAAGNYQTALDLANYVKTLFNSKSLDVNTIIADAQAGLIKMVQEKAVVAN